MKKSTAEKFIPASKKAISANNQKYHIDKFFVKNRRR
jgi:hypothetical protein